MERHNVAMLACLVVMIVLAVLPPHSPFIDIVSGFMIGVLSAFVTLSIAFEAWARRQ